jgi:hypothetical protein
MLLHKEETDRGLRSTLVALVSRFAFTTEIFRQGNQWMLKRLIIAFVTAALCVVSASAQSRRRQNVAAAADAAIIDIIQIDFKNYTFPLNGRTYKLTDGYYAETIAPGNTQWELMLADGPYYGDLTGDRKAEVAFILRYGPVGSPDMAEARIYTLRGGKPLLLSTLVVANSVSCELDHYMDIDDGMIRIERTYGNGAQCDRNEITHYRWDGSGFMPVGEVKRMPCRCM